MAAPPAPVDPPPMAGSPDEPHRPVLLDRVVELLTDTPDGPVLDGTLGAAGHARGVTAARLRRYGHAHLVGIDRDADALLMARSRLADLGDDVTITLAHARFDDSDRILDRHGVGRLAGALLDLGISSMHVDRPERGFSYRHEGPLDMRMDPTAPVTAADLVNESDTDELTRILREYGEEKFARRIAEAIVRERPFATTTQLAAVVRAAIPAAARRRGGHPATRTFQALRIAVNDELEALDAALQPLIQRLAPGGVLVVLAYHSLEDRIVKRAFADAATGCICPPGFPVCTCGRVPLVEHVVRRVERPDVREIARNPRASAARLRAVRRLEDPEEAA